MLFSCNLCSQTFSTKTKFNNHKNAAHVQKVLSCDKCKQSFISKSDIDEHDMKCDGKIEEKIETGMCMIYNIFQSKSEESC